VAMIITSLKWGISGADGQGQLDSRGVSEQQPQAEPRARLPVPGRARCPRQGYAQASCWCEPGRCTRGSWCGTAAPGPQRWRAGSAGPGWPPATQARPPLRCQATHLIPQVLHSVSRLLLQLLSLQEGRPAAASAPAPRRGSASAAGAPLPGRDTCSSGSPLPPAPAWQPAGGSSCSE